MDYNAKAIEDFGKEHANMPDNVSCKYTDKRLGDMNNYVEHRFIEKEILSKFPRDAHKELKILDVGAGKGRMTEYFVDISENCVALEPYKPFYDKLKEKLKYGVLETYQQTLKEFIVSDQYFLLGFDIIYISGVTPYLNKQELKEFLKDVKSLLSPVGVALIRDYGCIGMPTHQINQELCRNIDEMKSILMEDFQLLKTRRTYAPNIFWALHNKYNNYLTNKLMSITSHWLLYPIWNLLSKLDIRYKCKCFMSYIIN